MPPHRTDCNYWPAIDAALDSEPLKVQRMLYALLFQNIMQVHRTAVGMGGVCKTADGPWVDIPLDLQDRGLPPRLPTLGPLESMQMMMKIQDFMSRAAQDPSLLLSRRGWREVCSCDPTDPWS